MPQGCDEVLQQGYEQGEKNEESADLQGMLHCAGDVKP